MVTDRGKVPAAARRATGKRGAEAEEIPSVAALALSAPSVARDGVPEVVAGHGRGRGD